ncbi:response regulator transcription factor [Thalassotalea agarivorans]|uniref:DNA-binding response regulator, OmpR family, contains REC and winged-helix (WHTH) domain n=1 Tax=Thalassotalea agarivorans TaxID=349064 RepID=A0A1I0HP85_THASX|nr:response regulator transcription factor [Thalassotalea agarivorans]SET85814.1 DNA-binding response regulator, OmpR family, contains REC and winged-helix (wHTH) domain [Thalassotalea agarivorans]
MTNSALKVLIVEDNVAISKNIATFFEQKNLQLDFAYDGLQATSLALENFYDVVVLDVAMPKMDGLAVCQQLREKSQRHIPIIMLTARDTLDDKLKGFAQGADDYLTKPFALEELYVRVIALAQRHSLHKPKVLSLGTAQQRLSLDISTKQVIRAGHKIHLQPIPFSILHILMEAHPRAVTRSELCERIWGDDQTSSDALRSHLYQLRKALDKPFQQPLIKTLHGIGFSLDL